MGWIPPKTDWQPTDYFNLNDYNRISGNISYIKNFARNFVDRIIYIKKTGTKDSYSDMLEPSEVNNFQKNLREINRKTFQFEMDEDTVYTKAGFTPTYEQWNRIEGYTLQLHDEMKNNTTATRLTQKLGNTDSRRGIRL